MISRKQSIVFLTLFSLLGMSFSATPSWADLERYVRKPEAQFGWKLRERIESEQSNDRIYDLHFVSQTWQGHSWEHQLQVYQPQSVAPNSTIFLWVTGGSARPAYVFLGT
jgi:PhoPQ-activated pathogenicity-related protein